MIKVSVLYPHQDDGNFNFDYYEDNHIALVKQKLEPLGMVRVCIDRGLGGAIPGSPPIFVAMAHLQFENVEAFQSAFAHAGQDLMADIPNYTNLQPQIQISEIIDTDT